MMSQVPEARLFRLEPEAAEAYEKLTYARLRPLLRRSTDDSVIAYGASFSGRPAGLALAECSFSGGSAVIHSLFVKSDFRHMGIGGSMLRQIERTLADKGCTDLEIGYVSKGKEAAVLERLLMKHGWRQPEPRLWIYKIQESGMKAAGWIHRTMLPPDFTVSEWCGMTLEERRQLSQAEGDWYPARFSPFRDELQGAVEPIASLVLRFRGEIIGWNTALRIAGDTILYATLYIREPFRQSGLALALLAEAIKRHLGNHVPYGMFAVYIHNKAMLRVVNRLLKPLAESVQTYSRSFKRYG